MEDMTELPNEKPMQERGENEGNPMRYPPRQFAATPDPENPHRVLRMDDDHGGVDGEEIRIARDRNNVPEITIESMTSTTEESKDDAHDGGDEEEEQQSVVRDKKESEEKENTENESLRIDFGKPVERVASPMKPRPSSPIPGRRPQIPLMALVVGAAVEKSRLDDTLGSDEAIYQQSASKYNSLLNPRDNQVSRKSLVAEIMQTDPHGNKLEKAPSLGRYQPMGSDDVSLLRPSEMQSYKSRSSSETQHSVSQSEKLSATESAGKESIEVTKETDTDKGISFLKKFLGARGSDSGPVASADKKPVTSEDADVNESGGLASTAGVLTSMIRWKTKKKLHTGTRETREKYPGYLDLFTRLSRELNTSVPFPILLQTRREALPIIQNIAKAYKSTLGLHHQMTRQACAKVEKLRSELQDSDVFL